MRYLYYILYLMLKVGTRFKFEEELKNNIYFCQGFLFLRHIYNNPLLLMKIRNTMKVNFYIICTR